LEVGIWNAEVESRNSEEGIWKWEGGKKEGEKKEQSAWGIAENAEGERLRSWEGKI